MWRAPRAKFYIRAENFGIFLTFAPPPPPIRKMDRRRCPKSQYNDIMEAIKLSSEAS